MEPDPDVARLVREERLVEAAELASGRGDPKTASLLYERACDWLRAAEEALRAGDAARALCLGAEGGHASVAEKATRQVAARREAVDAVVHRLEHRGHPNWAARVLEESGRLLEAAKAWERAGEAARAAGILDRAGEPVAAARILERSLRRDPPAWENAVALGALLARFGKSEAAVRVLQRVPVDAAERPAALERLVPALDRLGLTWASLDASAELASLGGPPATEGAGN